MCAKEKTAAERVLPWLRNNFGKHSLGRLTGQDTRALLCAVQAVEMLNYSDASKIPAIYEIFRAAVSCMQPHTAWTAYHSVAMIMNWEDRALVWDAAGLPAVVCQRIAINSPKDMLPAKEF